MIYLDSGGIEEARQGGGFTGSHHHPPRPVEELRHELEGAAGWGALVDYAQTPGGAGHLLEKNKN